MRIFPGPKSRIRQEPPVKNLIGLATASQLAILWPIGCLNIKKPYSSHQSASHILIVDNSKTQNLFVVLYLYFPLRLFYKSRLGVKIE